MDGVYLYSMLHKQLNIDALEFSELLFSDIMQERCLYYYWAHALNYSQAWFCAAVISSGDLSYTLEYNGRKVHAPIYGLTVQLPLQKQE